MNPECTIEGKIFYPRCTKCERILNLILDRRTSEQKTSYLDIQQFFYGEKRNIGHHPSLDKHLRELGEMGLIYSSKDEIDRRKKYWFLDDCNIEWRRPLINRIQESPTAIYDVLKENSKSRSKWYKPAFGEDYGDLNFGIVLMDELLKLRPMKCHNCGIIDFFKIHREDATYEWSGDVPLTEAFICTCPSCGFKVVFSVTDI